LMYGLPFVFTFFIINFPAGLIVYWITTNLWTVGQGYILRKRLGPIKPVTDDLPAPVKAEEDEGVRKGLMARLMEATAKQPVSTAAKEPAAVGAKSGGVSAKSGGSGAKSGGASAKKPAPAPKPARSGPPPKPPRKKKKRSGRRR